jgi:RimJ/RimL family protein N-acetyltransferase
VHITSAIDNPKFMTRRLLHAIFATCFSRAARVTAMCRPENEKSIRAIRHLGFQYEGYCRLGLEGKWDALVFGMLRNECRWIRAPKEKTYEIAKAA